MNLFRNLRADEIECRRGRQVGNGVEILLYKTSRTDMSLLDETFGNFGWACQYKEVNGSLFCGLAIKDPDTDVWIWRWGCGTENNFEPEKSAASDSLKRAGFLFGLGRELYSAPRIVLYPENEYVTYRVAYIDYDKKSRIKDLQIVDAKGNLVFNFADFKVVPIEELPREEILKAVCGELKQQPEIDKENLRKFYYFYQPKAASFDYWNVGVVKNLWRKWQERSK